MEKTYTISEVSKLLGLTIDTVRFYEKKDMLHPKINPKNKYRIYDLYNILELLDIIFYRHLEIPVSDMYSIMHEKDERKALELIEKKRTECENRVRYEQQLLKKLNYLCDIIRPAIDRNFEIRIKKFPTSYVLLKSFDEDASHGIVLKNITGLTKDEYVLGSVIKAYDKDLNEKMMYYTIEKEIIGEIFGDNEFENEIVEEFTALSMVVPLENNILDKKYLDKLKGYAKENDIEVEDFIITHEINTTTYSDSDHQYAEIYLKIKDK